MAREMKDSGIAWIGEIPKGWELKRIKNICLFNPAPKAIKYDNVGYAPMNTVRYAKIEAYTISTNNLPSGLTYFENGDIVMAKVTPCFENGNIAIANELLNGCAYGSSELFVFRATAVEKSFLFYALQNEVFKALCVSTMTGTGGLKRVSSTFVANSFLPLPPLPEQRAIATFLDEKCGEIDELVGLQEKMIEELKAYKQAVITETVTKGLDKNVKMKDSGVEWIGQIPEEWEVSRLGLHSNIILGKMLCPNQQDASQTLESYFCAANVHFDGISGEIKQMWFSPADKLLYEVKFGDLLVVEGGAGAGGAAIVKELCMPTYIQNSIQIVRPYEHCDARYFKYTIERLVKNGYIDIVCNKATIPHFTKDKLARVPLCLPPLPEQHAIATYLDTKCADIDALISIKQKKIDELKNYKKSLIYEYVTGKKQGTSRIRVKDGLKGY